MIAYRHLRKIRHIQVEQIYPVSIYGLPATTYKSQDADPIAGVPIHDLRREDL